jgi:MFS family permease
MQPCHVIVAGGITISTNIPDRSDRLPRSSWHWLVVISLGFTWLLDGLQVALAGTLGGVLKTIAWAIILFFASSAASSAYLTISEIFPLEIRALAIACFYACGTLLGGVAAPALVGRLIGTHNRVDVFYGYLLAGCLMIGAALVKSRIGVKAEGRSLEDISAPLSSQLHYS